MTDVSSPAAAAAPNANAAVAQELPFQAEVQQILSLVIHSLYANKEVFLRELVSNASDALDKARFVALTSKDATTPEGEARIQIRADEDARTLTIEDNGIGMTKDEVIEHLGTIAKSGTIEFLKAHAGAAKSQDDALRLIGQFGVGFYAAFMVASRVDVSTRSMLPGAEPVLWRSSGAGTFTVGPGERATPGTEITLHLKEDAREFGKAWRLKELVKKYSDFVQFPITVAGEVANRSKALWALPKSQVTREQHEEFFQHITGGHEGDKPRLTVHTSVDAPIQFHALLYAPEKAPYDLFDRQAKGPRLYAKRVLILEHCDKVLQPYLRFLRGVVDSEDVSLNVSREMLQEDKALAQIEAQLTKHALKAIEAMAKDDPDGYLALWGEYGRLLKEGLATDWKNKELLADLARFESMNTEAGKVISLRQYVNAMPEAQKEIFYVTGPSRKAVEASPHLEAFKKRGFDVLFMIDPVDEWVVRALFEYDKRKLKSITHGEVDLGDAPEKKDEARPERVVAAVKAALGDRVKDVRFGNRLTGSACCLVADEGDASVNMERLLSMMDKKVERAKRILELNPEHAIVKSLDAIVAKSPDSPRVVQWAELLYDQATLAEGVLEDPAGLVKRVQALLTEVSERAAEDAKGG